MLKPWGTTPPRPGSQSMKTYKVAIIGVGVTAFRVLPPMWATSPLDAIIVGAALALLALELVRKAASRLAKRLA